MVFSKPRIPQICSNKPYPILMILKDSGWAAIAFSAFPLGVGFNELIEHRERMSFKGRGISNPAPSYTKDADPAARICQKHRVHRFRQSISNRVPRYLQRLQIYGKNITVENYNCNFLPFSVKMFLLYFNYVTSQATKRQSLR